MLVTSRRCSAFVEATIVFSTIMAHFLGQSRSAKIAKKGVEANCPVFWAIIQATAMPRKWKSNTLSSVVQWPLTPFSKPSRTKYDSYTSSDSEYKPDNLRSSAVQSGLERLKVTYGSLYKRPLVWGPRDNARLYRSGQTVTEPLKPRKVA